MNLLLILLRPVAAVVFRSIAAYQKKYHRLPEWYFFALERIALIPAYEILVTKSTDRGEEIFLVKRPANDPIWPNLWHFPGTILRFHDTADEIFARLAEELGVKELPSRPQLMEIIIQPNERGRHPHIFWRLEVGANIEFPTGQFFPINQLPTDTIAYEARNIEQLLG